MSTLLRAHLQHVACRRLARLLALALTLASASAAPGLAAPTGSPAPTRSPAPSAPAVGGISARALDGQGQPITTPYFDLDAQPGTVATRYLDIANHTDRQIPVDVGAVDATTSDNGGTAFLSRSAPRVGVGSWISPGRQSIVLGPRATTRLRFEVRVPQHAAPGDHVGGVVVEPQRKLHLGSTADITRVVRLALAVRVLVPGPATSSVDVSDLYVTRSVVGGPPIVSVTLASPGTLMCKPTVSSTFSRAGTVVSSERRTVDTLLPGAKVSYALDWTGSLPEDTYDVQFRAEGCGAPSSVSGTFRLDADGAEQVRGGAVDEPSDGHALTGLPRSAQIAGLVVVLLICATLGWWLGRRPKRERRRIGPTTDRSHTSAASAERPLTQRDSAKAADNKVGQTSSRSASKVEQP